MALSKEDNELLTRVGPETPMGALFRRFWTPLLLADELPHPDAPAVRVKSLGEFFAAFRVCQAPARGIRRFDRLSLHEHRLIRPCPAL